MSKVEEFIASNLKWLLTVSFFAVVGYLQVDTNTAEIVEVRNEIKDLEVEVKTVEERLAKKIKVINEVEKEVHDLEVRIAVLETTDCN